MNNEEKQKRHTTAHDRYRISDPICGLVETATSLRKAIERAKNHSEECKGVVIFDAMARIDCADSWDENGNILGFRHGAVSE